MVRLLGGQVDKAIAVDEEVPARNAQAHAARVEHHRGLPGSRFNGVLTRGVITEFERVSHRFLFLRRAAVRWNFCRHATLQYFGS